MKLYCISGLGADHSLFEKLELPGVNLIPVSWFRPQPNEALVAFAERLILKHQITAPCALAGLSFGGIVALEVAKLLELKPAPVFLISSLSSPDQLPWYFRLGRYLPLYKWLPAGGSSDNFVSRWLFQIKPADRAAFARVMRQSDPAFTRWAIEVLLHWEAKGAYPATISIHGTADRILPSTKHAAHLVPGAGHWMIRQEA